MCIVCDNCELHPLVHAAPDGITLAVPRVLVALTFLRADETT